MGETQMIGRRLAPAIVIAIAMVTRTVEAQRTEDVIFTYHSNAGGRCPDLDWYLRVAPDNSVTGMIGWQHMELLVRVTGTVDLEKRTFDLTGKEAGGNRTATIDGEIITRNHLKVHIMAPDVNADCPDINVWQWTPTGGANGG
jgi:hypothetical protein